MNKIRGSEIVRHIEEHQLLLLRLWDNYIPEAEWELSCKCANLALKMSETRHVLIEKDFTKQKEDET